MDANSTYMICPAWRPTGNLAGHFGTYEVTVKFVLVDEWWPLSSSSLLKAFFETLKP